MSDSKRSGCKGCLIWLLCLTALMLLVIAVGAYVGYRKFVSFRDRYTAPQPMALPAEKFTSQEMAATQKRIDQFLTNARAGRSNVQLVLSSRDLNQLVASSPFSNHVYLILTNNTVAGQFSIPFDALGIRFLHGRYLNGAGALNVTCANGDLRVNVKELSVNGEALPEHYMTGIRQQNFAEGIGTNAVTQESLERIQRVAVENDRLIFEVGGTNQTR